MRRAEPRDLAEIMMLRRQESDLHGGLDPRLSSDEAEMEEFRRAVRAALGGRSQPVIVAQDDESEGLSGYVIGRVVENRPFVVRRYGYVANLHVDEEAADARLRSSLLAAVLERFKAQGLTAAQVDVGWRDSAGRQFWQTNGFTRFLDHLYDATEPGQDRTVDAGAVVRKADSGDIDAVLALWEEMMEYHTPLDRRLRVLRGDRRYISGAVAYWLSDEGSSLLVAEVEGSVIGFALAGVVESALGLKSGIYGHIAHLCVTAGWRRRGVGRCLVAELREWFRKHGLSSIHIYVSAFSPVSQRFWRAVGFESYIERLWCDL